MADVTVTDLGLGDLVLIALYSPLEKNAPNLNDGVDEVLAGADLLETTLRGEFRDDRRAALREIRAHADGRCAAGIDRLTARGLVHRDGPVEFLVKLPGSRPRGIGRVPPLVFDHPELGESLRHDIIRVLHRRHGRRPLALSRDAHRRRAVDGLPRRTREGQRRRAAASRSAKE